MKVLELKGSKSLQALWAFQKLMFGLRMLPLEAGGDIDSVIDLMSQDDKEKAIRTAVKFVTLDPDEVSAMLYFCTDANGARFSPANIENLGPAEQLECIFAVACELSKISLPLITEDEKKIARYSIDIRGAYVRNPESSLEEILNIAFYEAVARV